MTVLNNFIFATKLGAVVKPEGVRYLDLASKKARDERKKAKELLGGSVGELKGDIFSILGKFTGPMDIWIGAAKSVASVFGGIIKRMSKEKKNVSVSKFLFRHLVTLPFRWANLTKNKFNWYFKRRQLYTVLLSIATKMKGVLIFIIKLFQEGLMLFAGLKMVVGGIIGGIKVLANKLFGTAIGNLLMLGTTAMVATWAFNEFFGTFNDLGSRYQTIVDTSHEATAAQQKDFLSDFEKTQGTFYKIKQVQDNENVQMGTRYHEEFNSFLKSWNETFDYDDPDSLPNQIPANIGELLTEIESAMNDLLKFVGPAALQYLPEEGTVTREKALEPTNTAKDWLKVSSSLFRAIGEFHSDISELIEILKKHIEQLLDQSDDADPETIKRWNRALSILKGARLFKDTHILEPPTEPGEEEARAVSVYMLQTMVQDMTEKAMAPVLPKLQTGGMMEEADIIRPESLDKKTRRFRDLRITVNGELELMNIDGSNLSSIATKLSSFVEEEVNRKW